MPSLPVISIAKDASTSDCKRLLDQIPAQDHPGGSAKGAWKRLFKRGSGARVERAFEHPSGLFALVSQTPGRLAVERLGQSVEELEAAPAASAPRAKPASLEARASAQMARRVSQALAGGGDDEEDEDEEAAPEAYRRLAQEAAMEPSGGPLRVALGNLFEFELPSDDPEMEEMFSFSALADGLPGPDQPHLFEHWLPGADSPNESCDHWIHLEPQEAIEALLANGFKPSARSLDPKAADVHPEYQAILRAKAEALLLDQTAEAGKPSARAPRV